MSPMVFAKHRVWHTRNRLEHSPCEGVVKERRTFEGYINSIKLEHKKSKPINKGILI